MAITVNSNIPSMNAQRHLQRSTAGLAKSLERLSSGLRINRASDDAAGLAISENLRSQVMALGVAVRNANDGISMLSTAEGGISEVSNILHRIRELAVQAANDTNSSENRAALNLEVTQLREELTRISTTIEFNGRNLFDGSFQNMKLQTGAYEGDTIDITIPDLRAVSLGAVAVKTSNAPTAALTGTDLIINNVTISATSADGISFANGIFSAIAMVEAINTQSASTLVTAKVNDTSLTAPSSDIDAVSVDGTTESITINGVNIGAVEVVDDDDSGALRQAINAVSNQTGVTATINASKELVLTAADGRNITVTTVGSIGDELGLVGADGDYDATTTGTYTLISDDVFSIAGDNPGDAGLSSTSVGVDPNTAINTVDVTTRIGAGEAITKIDYALRQINNIRAGLGATTNRLEMTISNLEAITENLAASESRIRDADFAKETAELTKNQILQQAGTAILAQANVTPQAALQLLQG